MVKINYFFNDELKFEITVSQKIARMIVKTWYKLSGKKAIFLYSDDIINFSNVEFSVVSIMKFDCKGKTVTGASYEMKRIYLECKTIDNCRLSEAEELNKMVGIISSLSAVKSSMLNFA